MNISIYAILGINTGFLFVTIILLFTLLKAAQGDASAAIPAIDCLCSCCGK